MFPLNLDVSLNFVSGNTEILEKKIHCSPWDQPLSVKFSNANWCGVGSARIDLRHKLFLSTVYL